MPGKERGGPRGKPGGGGSAGESAPAGPAVAPFDGKVDEIVAKIVPEHLLPTVFAATAVGAALFFIIMFIGFFTGSSDASLQEEIDALGVTLEEVQGELAVTKQSGEEAVAAKEKAEGKAEVSLKKATELQAKLNAAAEREKELKTKVSGLRRDLKTEGSKLRVVEVKEKKTAALADRDRKAAAKALTGLTERLEKGRLALEKGDAKYKRLQKEKEERAVIEERGRLAFETIFDGVSAIADPEEKIQEIERLREESKKELAGSVYMERLDAEIGRQRSLVEKAKKRAEKKAKRAAKEGYAAAMNKLKTAGEHDARMAVLMDAKAELSGTAYEVRIDKEIAAREAAQKKVVARDVYENVIKKVRSSPDARAENLRALKGALAQTKGTRYGTALKRLVEALERK